MWSERLSFLENPPRLESVKIFQLRHGKNAWYILLVCFTAPRLRFSSALSLSLLPMSITMKHAIKIFIKKILLSCVSHSPFCLFAAFDLWCLFCLVSTIFSLHFSFPLNFNICLFYIDNWHKRMKCLFRESILFFLLFSVCHFLFESQLTVVERCYRPKCVFGLNKFLPANSYSKHTHTYANTYSIKRKINNTSMAADWLSLMFE